jgi:2-polyprenyl-6-methoxyphenol hydroxylase-like FAD-dependent oxidoreductase
MSAVIGYYDVVIIGAGPAGLLLSVCLSRWGYKIKHIDNRPVPTATGRADGIQPRSLEILKNLGLKRKIMAHDPAKVYEVAFWDPCKDGIMRTGTWPSCPSFIDARYPFTALLHQGLIERIFIDDLAKNGTRVDRPWTITSFENDARDTEYPVSVDLKNLDSNVTEHVRTKYLFSGEGAHSLVRERLGILMQHKDPIAHVWGVMDGVVQTDFPDIKMKCTIHSSYGSIMVIPREANMVRLYIQIASSTDKDWNPRKTATVEEVQRAAMNILKPYGITWDRVEWYSVYPIGQGIAEKYTLDHRVFMGGDACHTHSPKAGQGMNTAFHDAINLAWKLHHVESGFADRSILETYESERKYIAETLLTFDAQYAKLFSQRQPSSSEVGSANNHVSSLNRQTNGNDEKNEFVETFKANCEFATGFGIAYQPNIFNLSPNSSRPTTSTLFDPKGTKCRPGHILSPATVTRVIDANVVHLENEIPFNGSFRLFVFAGKLPSHSSHKSNSHSQSQIVQSTPLTDLATHLQAPTSFYTRFSSSTLTTRPQRLPNNHESHNPHSPFFSICLILAAKRSEIEISDLPALFRDYSAHVYADDVWDQRVPENQAAAHAKVGLGEESESQVGGVVVVRPDGHVGCVVGLVEGPGTVEALEEYFAGLVVGGKNENGIEAQEKSKVLGLGTSKAKAKAGVKARL